MGSLPARGRPWYKRFGYHAVRIFVTWSFWICFGFRVRGSKNIPRLGGALICPNHTSHLDPLIGGISTSRAMNFLAKKELFSVPLLRGLISFLDSIPIDRFGMSAGAIKEMLKRLKRQELILMFPEGTRSLDGRMGVVKTGFATLARRTNVPVIPVGIEGAQRAWPRARSFPIPGPRIRVVVGEPIQPEHYAQLTDEEFAQLLERRIKDCIREGRRQLRWPAERINDGLETRPSADQTPTVSARIDGTGDRVQAPR